MTGKIVDQYGSHDDANFSSEHSFKMDNISSIHYTNLEVATAVCLMVGLWQILMGILRLGILGIILSDHLVSGFTTAAAKHVVVSKTTNLFGIKNPPLYRIIPAHSINRCNIWCPSHSQSCRSCHLLHRFNDNGCSQRLAETLVWKENQVPHPDRAHCSSSAKIKF
jgi:hypothetical protein